MSLISFECAANLQKTKYIMQDKKFNVKLFILLTNKKLHINLSYKVYFWLISLTQRFGCHKKYDLVDMCRKFNT